jgi:hypothetical protein
MRNIVLDAAKRRKAFMCFTLSCSYYRCTIDAEQHRLQSKKIALKFEECFVIRQLFGFFAPATW